MDVQITIPYPLVNAPYFECFISDDGGNTYTPITPNQSNLPFTIPGLVPGADYVLKVINLMNNDNCPDELDLICFTVPAACACPQIDAISLVASQSSPVTTSPLYYLTIDMDFTGGFPACGIRIQTDPLPSGTSSTALITSLSNLISLGGNVYRYSGFVKNNSYKVTIFSDCCNNGVYTTCATYIVTAPAITNPTCTAVVLYADPSINPHTVFGATLVGYSGTFTLVARKESGAYYMYVNIITEQSPTPANYTVRWQQLGTVYPPGTTSPGSLDVGSGTYSVSAPPTGFPASVTKVLKVLIHPNFNYITNIIGRAVYNVYIDSCDSTISILQQNSGLQMSANP
jgi:hypothetical protein